MPFRPAIVKDGRLDLATQGWVNSEGSKGSSADMLTMSSVPSSPGPGQSNQNHQNTFHSTLQSRQGRSLKKRKRHKLGRTGQQCHQSFHCKHLRIPDPGAEPLQLRTALGHQKIQIWGAIPSSSLNTPGWRAHTQRPLSTAEKICLPGFHTWNVDGRQNGNMEFRPTQVEIHFLLHSPDFWWLLDDLCTPQQWHHLTGPLQKGKVNCT